MVVTQLAFYLIATPFGQALKRAKNRFQQFNRLLFDQSEQHTVIRQDP